MTNELFPGDDHVPDLFLDNTTDPGNSYPRRPRNLETSHRKMIPGFNWLAWIVVLALTAFMMFNSFMVQKQQKVVEMSKGELLQPVFMGKFALGIRELGKNQGAAQLESQSKDFLQAVDDGPIEQRFCHAILLNELSGPVKALKALKDLRKKTSAIDLSYNEKQERTEQILTGIFKELQEKKSPVVGEDDRKFLEEEYPWFGELALNTVESGSARRDELMQRAEYSVILLSLGVVAGLGLLAVGVIVLIIFLTRILNGSLRNRVVDDSRYGPVYIETFAIWFLLFLGVSLAVSVSGNESLGLSTAAITMLLPLSALIWPVIRGVPANEMLDDVGLRIKNPFVEILAGIAAYLAMLPMLLVGIIISAIVIVIMGLLQSSPANDYAPTGVPHPIANEAFNGDIMHVMITIFFIAAVLAPLTEEIMFRGILYRNLRDGSHRMARTASIIFASLFSSLIFAAIHPQGLAGIPVLTTLAFGFCLVRQWRGSLIAPMTMHAIHNGLATSFLIPLLI